MSDLFHPRSLLIALMAGTALVGCIDTSSDDDEGKDGAEAMDPDADDDGDGLTNAEELELGLDPASSDSDGDGFEDAEEVEKGNDPLDPDDVPYQGGWAVDPECRDTVGANAAGRPTVGSVAPNFTAPDQFGDEVSLHDFCGQAVLVVTGAEWCGPCQEYRSTMAQYWEDYHEDGLMILDFLGENASGGAPDQATLVSWADGHDYAVLADPNWAISSTGYVSGGIPAISLLGPGAEVIILDGYPQATDIEAALP